MPEPPTCPPCRLSPGVELPSGMTHGRQYPRVPMDPVYTVPPEILASVTEELRRSIGTSIDRIYNSPNYNRYWEVLSSFQLQYGGREWEVDAECDTRTGFSHARPGRSSVPCPPNREGTGYTTCQLCGQFPCRFVFHITSPETGESRWIGDECVLNYNQNPQEHQQLSRSLDTYRNHITHHVANLRDNTQRIILGKVWLQTHNGWQRSWGLPSRLYWKAADWTRKMLAGQPIVGREKYDYDMTVTGRLDTDPNVQSALVAQVERERQRSASTPPPPPPLSSRYRTEVDYLIAHDSHLDNWSHGFARDMDARLRSGQPPTDRQRQYIDITWQRLRRTLGESDRLTD